MGELLSMTNIILAIICSIFGVIGGIAGAIIFVNKTVNVKIRSALKSATELQASRDELCKQDRQGLDSSLQSMVGKNVLLETELRSPTTGVYVRLKEVETSIKYLEKEIEHKK